ncbi:MAG: aspartate/glutamate racemase family protein [Planctomycetes bacterium]|nr:aspartate/glutamate racemase family protein [Planctomycetota bacterium]
MKTIGLIGGMSWESTVTYYQVINRAVGRALGGLHSARIVLHSVEFDAIQRLQHDGRWPETGAILADAARSLHRAGADFVVLCTNTMHIVADAIIAATPLPFLHIADATAERIMAQGLSRIALLGTKFTMEEPFYKGRLEDRHGLQVLVPEPADRAIVHRVIYEELCRGRIDDDSRREYQRIVRSLIDAGAQGAILGCTEIGLLLGENDCAVPLFDTAQIHAEAAATFALG